MKGAKRQDQRPYFTVLSSILICILERKLRLNFVVVTTTRDTARGTPRDRFCSYQSPMFSYLLSSFLVSASKVKRSVF